tara:strand:+ start:29472 stop:31220 length:1749 start_codon:yes stop_codon:yes gene_type:complete
MSEISDNLQPDLESIRQARELSAKAALAQNTLTELTQNKIDLIVKSMAQAATENAESLAKLAQNETGFGIVKDKIKKNIFASEKVFNFIKPLKTVGVISESTEKSFLEIAEPFGPVAAVIPSTNPTSTTIYKILIALKARCSIVISPHPTAIKCIVRTAEIMEEAACSAGAPTGAINWMRTVTIEGTQALMQHRNIAVILATGGMGLVRAAYSAGKPAYGVGPGNAPAYIESSADIEKAVNDIITGKTFDNGVLCSSENSVVVDNRIFEKVMLAFEENGGHFLSSEESQKLSKILITSQRLPNPDLVGRSASFIADRADISIPQKTRVLIAPLQGVGRDFPLSIEKLCPVLSFYTVKDWQEGCERCKEILQYGGMGHTMSIHSKNEDIILEFGLKKPASRIVVNTPTTHGSIGLTTGLPPAMTLGCGGFGGNITSDNITPLHLLNIKRLAYEVKPVSDSRTIKTSTNSNQQLALPSPPMHPVKPSMSSDLVSQRAEAFLKTRAASEDINTRSQKDSTTSVVNPQSDKTTELPVPVEFVCEDDVRKAIAEHKRILIGKKTIVTPAARDLGNDNKIFIESELNL